MKYSLRSPAASESDKDESRSSGPLLFCTVAGVLFLLVLYVLSTGPVTWLQVHKYVSDESSFLRTVYAPIAWLVAKSPAFEKALTWYIEFFI